MIRLLSLTILMLLVAVGRGEDKSDDFNARLSFNHRNISLGEIAQKRNCVKTARTSNASSRSKTAATPPSSSPISMPPAAACALTIRATL